MRKLLFSLLCLIINPLVYGAVDPMALSVTASVNKTALTMQDELTLTLKVEGIMGDFSPQLPSMPAFNVYARSVSKEINNFQSTTTFSYVMMPRFPGKTVIEPISITYANKTYRTEPITVTVYRTTTGTAPQTAAAKTAPSRNTTGQATDSAAGPVQLAPSAMPALERDLFNRAARQGQQDYFMVAAVSNTSPYANQTVTFAVRFYYSKPFSDSAPYTAPTISNLFLEEIGRSDGSQTISGRRYSYAEIRYAATGVTAGKAQIGAAQINFIPVLSRSGASLIDRMFAAVSTEPQTVQSNPISLTIRPVPQQGQPESFYGAVGTGYKLSASLDRSEVEAGEAVNLTIKVNGPGNLKSTSDLKMPNIPGFKTYEVASSAAAVPANGTLSSYKLFKTVLVPTASGTYTIAAFAWSYYDPSLKQYRTLYTQPLSLTVTPSSKTDSGFDFSSHSDLGKGFQELGHDIHYLKTTIQEPSFNFLQRMAAWSAVNYVALALLVLAGLFALLDKRTLAEKRGLAKVKSQLKAAHNAQSIADALSTYLQIKYGIHTASLPLRTIQDMLKEHSGAATQVEQFTALWQQLEAERFAPVVLQARGIEDLAQRALHLIQQMEKAEYK